jgi:hypothetical protein
MEGVDGEDQWANNEHGNTTWGVYGLTTMVSA